MRCTCINSVILFGSWSRGLSLSLPIFAPLQVYGVNLTVLAWILEPFWSIRELFFHFKRMNALWSSWAVMRHSKDRCWIRIPLHHLKKHILRSLVKSNVDRLWVASLSFLHLLTLGSTLHLPMPLVKLLQLVIRSMVRRKVVIVSVLIMTLIFARRSIQKRCLPSSKPIKRDRSIEVIWLSLNLQLSLVHLLQTGLLLLCH